MEEKDLNTLVQKLQLQLSQKELLEKMQNQIQKDFLRSGVGGFELKSPDPAHWNGEIQTMLKKLSENEL